jgi:hypothetical protein
MDRSHHGPDHAFDVAPVVRQTRYAVIDRNAIFLTTTRQRLGVELLRIVHVDRCRESRHGPVECVKLAISKPADFRQDCMREGQRN